MTSRSPRRRAPARALTHAHASIHPFLWDDQFVRSVGQRARAPLAIAAWTCGRLQHQLEQTLISARTPEIEDLAYAFMLARLMVMIIPPHTEDDLRTKAEALWRRAPGRPDVLLEHAIEAVLIEDALRLNVVDPSVFSNPDRIRTPF